MVVLDSLRTTGNCWYNYFNLGKNIRMKKTERCNSMVINIVLGFIVPVVVSLFFFRIDPKLFALIYPVGISLACVINIIGFDFSFWKLKPFKFHSFSALPIDLGLYPCLLYIHIFLIHDKAFNPTLSVVFFALFTTFLEFIAVRVGKVIYSNGWNIWFTCVSYFIPFTITYWYYLCLVSLDVLQR